MIENAAFDSKGDLRVSFVLSKEDHETLAALAQSPYWALYRKVLINAKDAFFNSVLAIKDPNDMMKHVGIVAGINFAINQLTVINDEYKRKIEKEKKSDKS